VWRHRRRCEQGGELVASIEGENGVERVEFLGAAVDGFRRSSFRHFPGSISCGFAGF
jgi:hypothetical protein